MLGEPKSLLAWPHILEKPKIIYPLYLYTSLEIRYSPVVAPVTVATPPQRLILRPADLAGLGIRIALELGLRAAEQALIDILLLFLLLLALGL